MSFSEELIIKIVESGIIGLVLIIIGYWLNKSLSKFKNEQAKLFELERQNITLKNSIIQDKRIRKLEKINKQLAEFYFPINFRLQKDDALWRLSPKLSKQAGALPKVANDIIENDYILSNHLEIVSIIESKSHLIEIDPTLQEQIREYIKHVAIYNTIRKVENLTEFNPIDFGSDYPKRFQEMIVEKIEILQKKHELIFNEITN